MTVRRVSVVVVMVVPTLVGFASPAAALSCIRFPDDAHLGIAAGDPEPSGGVEFFERWHHLLLGRVVGVTTDEDERSPTWGRTQWTVEVSAALGEGTVPARVGVQASDPGWLNGYAFTVGDAFAIPVWHIEELGYWSSFACDPITEVDDLDATVEEVLAVAASHGTPIASVGDADAGTGPVAASAALAVVLTGGGAFALWRRRHLRRRRQSVR